jgi:DNA transformation protein
MAKPRPALVDHYAEEFSALGEIEVKHFFGGWQFRCGGRQFAAFIRDALYFRADDNLRQALQAAGSEPFWYEKQGKRVTVGGYQTVPDSALDDPIDLLFWAEKAIAAK